MTHTITVPPMAGIAPYCSCGWPETEGGKSMVWRYGDKTAAEHLREVSCPTCLHPLDSAEHHAECKGGGE